MTTPHPFFLTVTLIDLLVFEPVGLYIDAVVKQLLMHIASFVWKCRGNGPNEAVELLVPENVYKMSVTPRR